MKYSYEGDFSLATIILIIFCATTLINFLFVYFTPTDSTDVSKWNRSGMKVYTDHATGVQYLSTGGIFFSNLTPRLGLHGKPYLETEGNKK